MNDIIITFVNDYSKKVIINKKNILYYSLFFIHIIIIIIILLIVCITKKKLKLYQNLKILLNLGFLFTLFTFKFI